MDLLGAQTQPTDIFLVPDYIIGIGILGSLENPTSGPWSVTVGEAR